MGLAHAIAPAGRLADLEGANSNSSLPQRTVPARLEGGQGLCPSAVPPQLWPTPQAAGPAWPAWCQGSPTVSMAR